MTVSRSPEETKKFDFGPDCSCNEEASKEGSAIYIFKKIYIRMHKVCENCPRGNPIVRGVMCAQCIDGLNKPEPETCLDCGKELSW